MKTRYLLAGASALALLSLGPAGLVLVAATAVPVAILWTAAGHLLRTPRRGRRQQLEEEINGYYNSIRSHRRVL